MDREREQTWLIVAAVTAAHALALAGVVAFWMWRRPVPTEGPRTIAIAPAPAVAPARLLPPPPEVERLGEATGTGDSIATVDLPTPAVTDRPDAFDQAWTRRRPTFAAPSAAAASPNSETAETQQEAAEPQALGPPSVSSLRSFTTPKVEAAGPVTEGEAEAKPETAAAPTEPVEPEPVAEAVASSDRPPDPAVAGESDLDAFVQEEGAAFAPGGVAARQGREVKLVRPRIELAFMADATRLAGRDLVVKLIIESDAAGHPRRVEVIGSSGSDTIDDAVRLAMYDSWFGGKMPDRFPFTVRFVRR